MQPDRRDDPGRFGRVEQSGCRDGLAQLDYLLELRLYTAITVTPHSVGSATVSVSRVEQTAGTFNLAW